MELYLLRHGIAEDRAATGRDADRRLTEEGREKLRRVMERVYGAGVRPSLILSIQYRRALETAEIAARELGYEGKLGRTEALTPDSSPRAVWDLVREERHEAELLLVGHEPLLSATVAYLIGSTQAMMIFPPGALVRFAVDGLRPAPAGMLQWMLTAELA
jgi:phosphohistidine phosphatase